MTIMQWKPGLRTVVHATRSCLVACCLYLTALNGHAQELTFPDLGDSLNWTPGPAQPGAVTCPGAQPSADSPYAAQIFAVAGEHLEYHRSGAKTSLEADCKYHELQRRSQQFQTCSGWVIAPASLGSALHEAVERGLEDPEAERQRMLDDLLAPDHSALHKKFAEDTFERTYKGAEKQEVKSTKFCHCMALPVRRVVTSSAFYPDHCANTSPP